MLTLLFLAKRALLLAVLLLLLASPGLRAQGLQAAPSPPISLLMPTANPTRLHADVAFLTGIKPARQYRNLASLNKAADYIHAEFKKLGGPVTEQKFLVEGHEYRNIIASFGPPDAERLIVGAHYDVCGEQPGADDNASAVAGLLETARLLQPQAASLKRRIDFVAYSLEEPPFFATEHMGSAVHAAALHAEKARVRAMLCYEMIGYFSDAPGSQRFPDAALAAHYPSTGNFIIVVGKQGQETLTQQVQTLMRAHSTIDVQRINLPASQALAGLSDHRNYWHYGYEALMINDTSFLRNPNYHQASDTIDTLDFQRMAQVVNGVFGALLAL